MNLPEPDFGRPLRNPVPRQIGVFGGAFDPPHAGHAAVARHAFAAIPLDQLLWVPSLSPPHREASATPFEHRIGMVSALIRGWSGHAVSRIEESLPRPHYALNTLTALAEAEMRRNSDAPAAWHWILGSDQWALFSTWHRHEELLNRARFWIYPRPGFPLPEAFPPSASPLSGAPFSESSSAWRAGANAGVAETSRASRATPALPAPVSAYIAAHGLYA